MHSIAKTFSESSNYLVSSLNAALQNISSFQYPKNYYPSNIMETAESFSFEDLYEIEYNDGIAVFHVMRPRLIDCFLRAKKGQERRVILSDAYFQILDDCQQAIDESKTVASISERRKKQDE